jgi:hypothetical protein
MYGMCSSNHNDAVTKIVEAMLQEVARGGKVPKIRWSTGQEQVNGDNGQCKIFWSGFFQVIRLVDLSIISAALLVGVREYSCKETRKLITVFFCLFTCLNKSAGSLKYKNLL